MKTSYFIKALYDKINYEAFKKALDREQRKELFSVGISIAYENIDRYENRPDEEILNILSTIARNGMNKYLRDKINWERGILSKQRKERPIDNWSLDPTQSVDEILKEDSNFDIIDQRQFLFAMQRRLNDKGKKILSELIEPSEKTIQIQTVEKIEKIKAREKGALKMNVFTDKITSKHISKSLGFSEATVCREMVKIREAAASLISEQFN